VSEWLARLRGAFEALSLRERGLVAAVGAVLALLLFVLAVVNPLRSAAERARARVGGAEAELEAVVRLRGELDEVRSRLDAVERRIREGPRGNIFTTLESLARESAIKVDSMEPQTAASSEEYRETRVQVTLKGVSLAQLANYLHRIESTPQLLSVKSLRIRTRDGEELLDVTFSVSSFEAV
jgi:type II secretory pathway component PulM